MTPEPPTPPARPPRPGPAFRRAALGLPPDPGEAAADAPARPAPLRRESLRESLARIPDLEPPTSAAGGVEPEVDALGAASGALRVRASRLLNGAPPAGPGVVADSDAEVPVPSEAEALVQSDESQTDEDRTDEDLASSIWAVLPSQSSTDTSELRRVVAAAPDIRDLTPAPAPFRARRRSAVADGDAVVAAPRKPPPKTPATAALPWWRRLGFAASVVLLVGAIPVLGKAGYDLVTQSTDGKFSTSVKSELDPGYEDLVDSTPTQLVIQSDANGAPVAVTFLSLSGESGGGSVIFIPLETAVRRPAFGVDRLSRAFSVLEARPPDGRKQVAVQTAGLLNVGIDSVVDLDDRGWEQIVSPVAPLGIDNPDPIKTESLTVPSGPVELSATQVGPYLNAWVGDESDISRFNRHELVWSAWLKAIAESGRDDVIPGETGSGIGLFARTLARGPVTFATLPTKPANDGTGRLLPNDAAIADLVLSAVPAPDPASPGSRATVRVLNGVAPDPIPDEILQSIVRAQGSLSIVGNGPSFGRTETTITYADPAKKGFAVLIQVALGAGRVRLDREADDSVDITIILGRDVVDGASATTTTTPAIDQGSDTSIDAGTITSTTGGP